jgi:DNA-binding CsgD family transcriptional regulator
MTIRHRPMRGRDVHECVDIVATNSVARSRYGSGIGDLCPAWLRLLETDSFCSARVFEELNGAMVKIVGVGISVFVSDGFLQELKKPPHFWIGPELAGRVLRRDAAVLSAKQIREDNSGRGLNLAIWQGTVRPEYAERLDVWNALMAAGVEQHRGYRLKELLVAQAESVEHLLGLRHTGGFFWNGANSRYGDLPQSDLQQLIGAPHVLGMTKEMAVSNGLASITSTIGSLFLYEPPRFGFSRSEQRLLLAALNGRTDQELHEELGVSLATIKKAWRSVYDRVAICEPRLLPGNSPAYDGALERGREKKQRLIAHLREHPEELRPISRKALREANGPAMRRLR